MIGIDTKILVRHLTQDDPQQSRRVERFFQARSSDDPAFVSLVVVAEICWVITKTYAFKHLQVIDAFQRLLRSDQIQFEETDFLTTLFFGPAIGGDIADHIIAHIATQSGCAKTVTFDQAAAQNIPGMELLA